MAITLCKLEQGKDKSFIVTDPRDNSPHSFKEPAMAFAYKDKIDAEILAASETRGTGVTSVPRFRLTYRNQFQWVPRGESNPAVSQTQDVLDAMIEAGDLLRFVLTYRTNKARVARDYASMPKSVGREQAKEQPKVNLETVEPTADQIKAFESILAGEAIKA